MTRADRGWPSLRIILTGALAGLFVSLQHLLPHHRLSRLIGWLATRDWPVLKDLSIRLFIRLFGVEINEAVEREPSAYPNFNAFFTRALRVDARPLDTERSVVVSPADGMLSEWGSIRRDRLVQAKGRDFSLTELLGGDETISSGFHEGSFATIYLSPRDYHRVHMPLAGELQTELFIPGRLFSVNRITSQRVPRLYARNERLVCLFDTQVGPMALVLVGAIFVGSIQTSWATPTMRSAQHVRSLAPWERVGERERSGARRHLIVRGGSARPMIVRATPSRYAARRWDYTSDGAPIRLARGAEMGRFNMGSTVILLLPPGTARWTKDLAPGGRVRMGQAMGWLTSTADAPQAPASPAHPAEQAR